MLSAATGLEAPGAIRDPFVVLQSPAWRQLGASIRIFEVGGGVAFEMGPGARKGTQQIGGVYLASEPSRPRRRKFYARSRILATDCAYH
jgi:hypothetical protein